MYLLYHNGERKVEEGKDGAINFCKFPKKFLLLLLVVDLRKVCSLKAWCPGSPSYIGLSCFVAKN